MSTYYVDPDATGSDTGAEQTNAWTSLQRAIDGTNGTQPTAGDIVKCRADGTSADETITVLIDIDGNTGTAAAPIQYVGVNSSWVDDGTQYKIVGDAGTTPVNILSFSSATVDYNQFKNFRVSGASSHGINFSTPGPSYNGLDNVASLDNGGGGVNLQSCNYGTLFRCLAENNSQQGFYYITANTNICLSVAKDNTGDGILSYSVGTIFGCLCHNNAKGCSGPGVGGAVINNVFDSNSSIGCEIYGSHTLHFGNRYTNNGTYGLDGNLKSGVRGYNYYQNNTTANQTDMQNYDAGGEQFDQGDTDSGYNSLSGDEFNLTSAATLRGNTAIELPD